MLYDILYALDLTGMCLEHGQRDPVQVGNYRVNGTEGEVAIVPCWIAGHMDDATKKQKESLPSCSSQYPVYIYIFTAN